jgi:phosphatidylglycerol lysyltransferase
MACPLPPPCLDPPLTRSLIDARRSRLISGALRIGLVALAGWALRRELGGVRVGALLRHLGEYGWRHVALAAAGTVGSFLALGGIERLALRYAAPAVRIPRRVAMLTGFVSNAFSQSVGLALLTGTAVRLRGYARHPLDAAAVGRTSAFVTLAVSLGLMACGAVALLSSAQPIRLPGVTLPMRSLGLLLGLVVVAYLGWSAASSGDHLGRGRWKLMRPTGRIALAQVSLACVDWLLSATVLFAVLPVEAGLGYWELLRAYLVAQTAGMASHVPGGAGVLEVVMLALVAGGNATRQAAVVAALVMFRIVYYLAPLLAAVVLAAATELRPRRRKPMLPIVPSEMSAQREG